MMHPRNCRKLARAVVWAVGTLAALHVPPVVGVAATIPVDRVLVPWAASADVGYAGAFVIVGGGVVLGLGVAGVGWYLVGRVSAWVWRRWVDRDDDAET